MNVLILQRKKVNKQTNKKQTKQIIKATTTITTKHFFTLKGRSNWSDSESTYRVEPWKAAWLPRMGKRMQPREGENRP